MLGAGTGTEDLSLRWRWCTNYSKRHSCAGSVFFEISSSRPLAGKARGEQRGRATDEEGDDQRSRPRQTGVRGPMAHPSEPLRRTRWLLVLVAGGGAGGTTPHHTYPRLSAVVQVAAERVTLVPMFCCGHCRPIVRHIVWAAASTTLCGRGKK